MAQDLIPIKVKIGLRPNGHADHPNWDVLPCMQSGTAKDHMPSGWIYDKKYGHQEEGPDSPFGQQWGCVLVSEIFAQEAIAEYPTLVTELTEAEFEDFYNTRSRAHMPEVQHDTEVLAGLETERNLRVALGQDTTALDTKIAKALDPNDDEPGVKVNKDKYWSDFKAKKGFKIKVK